MTEIDFDYIVAHCNARTCLEDLGLLYRTADAISPKVLLEVGAENGCSSMTLGFIAHKHGGHLYSVEAKPRGVWMQNIKSLGFSDCVTLIQAISPWVSQEIVDRMNLPIDYLLIDGDHHPNSCLLDYYFWNHYVRQGGCIAFHDYWGNAYAVNVQAAINHILQTDRLVEVGHTESPQGMIVFQKP